MPPPFITANPANPDHATFATDVRRNATTAVKAYADALAIAAKFADNGLADPATGIVQADLVGDNASLVPADIANAVAAINVIAAALTQPIVAGSTVTVRAALNKVTFSTVK